MIYSNYVWALAWELGRGHGGDLLKVGPGITAACVSHSTRRIDRPHGTWQLERSIVWDFCGDRKDRIEMHTRVRALSPLPDTTNLRYDQIMM